LVLKKLNITLMYYYTFKCENKIQKLYYFNQIYSHLWKFYIVKIYNVLKISKQLNNIIA